MGAALPTGRWETSAVWAGQNAYIFGGAEDGSASSQIVRYDSGKDLVTVMRASLPTQRKGTSAVWDGRHAYIFGGYHLGSFSDQILRYNPATDELTPMSATLPTSRYLTSAVWDGRYAYIFGGHDNNGQLREIVRYDPAKDEILIVESRLPRGLGGTSAIWAGQNAYLFGGYEGQSDSSEILQYNPRDQTVKTMISRLSTGRERTSAIWDGTYAYVFGGLSYDSGRLNQIVRYNPATDTAALSSSVLPKGRMGTSAVWTGQYAHIFGGTADGQALREILRYAPTSAETLPSPPTAPTDLVATADEDLVSLSWIAPSGGTENPTSYRVFRGTASGEVSLVTSGGCANLGNVLKCADGGLAPGQTYYYKISAVNGAGEGPRSNEAAATPGNRPGAPRNLVAAPSNGQVVLSWTAPATGLAPSNYKVYRGASSGSETPLVVVGQVLEYADPEVEKGRTYYYQVTARNSAGEGPRSGETSATLETNPPSAAWTTRPPASVQSGAEMPVAWSASGPYSVLAIQWSPHDPRASGCCSPSAPASGSTGPLTGTWLTLKVPAVDEITSVNYTIRVRSAATGVDYFAPVALVTVFPPARETIPGSPTSLTATTVDGETIRLNWNAPANNGGSAITSYKVFRGSSAGSASIVTSGGCANLGRVLSCTDSGLTNGQAYYYTVRAVNGVGQGAPSDERSATPTTTTTAAPSPQAQDADGVAYHPCSDEPSLRSTDASQATQIRFSNEGGQTVSLFWLDYQGRRVFYHDLSPAGAWNQPSFATHPWLIVGSDGACRAIYVATTQSGKVTIADQAAEASLPTTEPAVPPTQKSTTQTSATLDLRDLWSPVTGEISRGFFACFEDPPCERFHGGIDITSPLRFDAEIRAAFSGMVANPLPGGSFGTHVVVNHPDGVHRAVYAHLCEAAVRPGESVQRGQVIGRMGNTGEVRPLPIDPTTGALEPCNRDVNQGNWRFNGIHLHFEIQHLPAGNEDECKARTTPGRATDETCHALGHYFRDAIPGEANQPVTACAPIVAGASVARCPEQPAIASASADQSFAWETFDRFYVRHGNDVISVEPIERADGIAKRAWLFRYNQNDALVTDGELLLELTTAAYVFEHFFEPNSPMAAEYRSLVASIEGEYDWAYWMEKVHQGSAYAISFGTGCIAGAAAGLATAGTASLPACLVVGTKFVATKAVLDIGSNAIVDFKYYTMRKSGASDAEILSQYYQDTAERWTRASIENGSKAIQQLENFRSSDEFLDDFWKAYVSSQQLAAASQALRKGSTQDLETAGDILSDIPGLMDAATRVTGGSVSGDPVTGIVLKGLQTVVGVTRAEGNYPRFLEAVALQQEIKDRLDRPILDASKEGALAVFSLSGKYPLAIPMTPVHLALDLDPSNPRPLAMGEKKPAEPTQWYGKNLDGTKSVGVELREKEWTIRVDSQVHDGDYLVLSFDKDGAAAVMFGNARVTAIDSSGNHVQAKPAKNLDDVLNPFDDEGEVEYLVSAGERYELYLSFPHFSAWTIVVTSAVQADPSGSIWYPWGFVLVGFVGLGASLGAGAYVLRKRRKSSHDGLAVVEAGSGGPDQDVSSDESALTVDQENPVGVDGPSSETDSRIDSSGDEPAVTNERFQQTAFPSIPNTPQVPDSVVESFNALDPEAPRPSAQMEGLDQPPPFQGPEAPTRLAAGFATMETDLVKAAAPELRSDFDCLEPAREIPPTVADWFDRIDVTSKPLASMGGKLPSGARLKTPRSKAAALSKPKSGTRPIASPSKTRGKAQGKSAVKARRTGPKRDAPTSLRPSQSIRRKRST